MSTWNGLLSPCSEMCFLNRDFLYITWCHCVCVCVCVCVRVCVRSVAQLCPTLCDPLDCSSPGSLSMEFSRKEYWSELPFLTRRDLPGPGIESTSLESPALAGRFFTTEPSEKLYLPCTMSQLPPSIRHLPPLHTR